MTKLDVILTILGSSVVTTIISEIRNAIKDKTHRNKIDRLLLLDALKRQCMVAIEAGKITLKDLQCIEEYYDSYKKLNGDGFADALVSKVRSLPIVGE